MSHPLMKLSGFSILMLSIGIAVLSLLPLIAHGVLLPEQENPEFLLDIFHIGKIVSGLGVMLALAKMVYDVLEKNRKD